MRPSSFASMLLLLSACGDSSPESGTTPEGSAGGACFANQTCRAALECRAGLCEWGYQSPLQSAAEGGPCCTGASCPNGPCASPLECVSSVCAGPEAGGVALTVSDEVAPEYGWSSSDLAVLAFVVAKSDPGEWIWAIRSEEGVSSPLRHGSHPAGATLIADGELTVGTEYRVVLSGSHRSTFFKDFTAAP